MMRIPSRNPQNQIPLPPKIDVEPIHRKGATDSGRPFCILTSIVGEDYSFFVSGSLSTPFSEEIGVVG